MKKNKNNNWDPEPFPYKEKAERIAFIEGMAAATSIIAIILTLIKFII